MERVTNDGWFNATDMKKPSQEYSTVTMLTYKVVLLAHSG